jgi:pimeloyl-ACP methyl ester carboxylesterase
MPERTGRLDLDDLTLAYRFVGPACEAAPTLVLLHEGLGSAELWFDIPEALAAKTGFGVFAYSRAGYGQSSPVALPRPLSYMHDEALHVLPRVLDAIGFRRGFLIGHSDGASIAAIYAGGVPDHRVRGVSLIAPHFIVEDLSVAAIAKARAAYETGDLRKRLAKYHADVDGAFHGWNGAWLDPAFRRWDIGEYLPHIRVPLQIVQGENDQYGTARQIAVARENCMGPLDVTLLPGIGHWPQREARDATLDLLAGFCARVRAFDDASA